jgi:hypothetical protein
MSFIISYWWLIIIIIAAIAVGGYMVYTFVKMPSDTQITKVKEWLLYAVAEAEKELGSGTGQLKLRYVYDKFIAKFPYLAKAISFEAFSLLVDEVLEKFKAMLESNKQISNYVNGDKEE